MLILALFLIVSVILLRLSFVQTYLGGIATDWLNSTYETDLVVEKVDLSFFGDVKLKEIDIKDHHKDSLIYIRSLTTSIGSFKDILDNKLELGVVDIDGLILNMVKHRGEDNDNFTVFIDKFDTKKEKKSDAPTFLMTTSQINLSDANFILYDKNKKASPIVFYKNINGEVEDFKVIGPNAFANIRDVSFNEDHGIVVDNLTTDFAYTKEQMTFNRTTLKTISSQIDGNIIFNYKQGDLSNFNDKVQIEGSFNPSSVSLNDLNKFYSEFGKNDIIKFTTNVSGTLNDFKLNQLKLQSNRNSVINGNFHFINAVNSEKGFSLNANINNLSSNYQNLKQLLPNILGKTLPSSFEKFGQFSIAGNSYVTKEMVNAQLEMNSILGKTITDLKLTNIDDIDNANYKGKVEFIDLDFGSIIKDSLVGKLSLIADVEGKGFTLETLSTKVKGTVSKHQYKDYTYSNIDVNGVFENQRFNGELNANDENLKMKFIGLADLSTAIYKFDFKADVGFAEFNKLNLFKRDSKAILKGKMDINLTGNTLDNISGNISFRNASYTNQNDNYFFTDFNVNSQFLDTTRVIKVNSTDIVNGTLKGRFKFKELTKLTKNSLGSIYTNFEPKRVTSGQFLDFNFKIYNKIIGVFFPEVKLGSNTSIKGKIVADSEKFELTFKSPEVEAYKNSAKNIRLQIDNKNPLYNTLLSIEKVNTKYYNVSDLNLVNVTLNDTLFFRTDFAGGRNLNEKFDLSFYHTLNENNKSVIGLKKSDIKFKNNKWLVNPTNNKQNKVVIDENFQTFAFDKINILSNNQEIDFAGIITGKNDKDVTLNLKNVKLEGITPRVDSLTLKGLVNGYINYKQIKGNPLPIADLVINDLHLNDFNQGNLIVNALGDNSLRKYIIDVSLENDEKVRRIDAKGEIDLEAKKPTIIANFKLNKFQLEPFNPLGKGVIDQIRGEVTGKGIITGLLRNPDFDGELALTNAGIAIPYLNVNYDFIGTSKVVLSKQQFRFLPTTLVDDIHDTEATLLGNISHTSFDDWYLDLKLETENFLVLNTKESEEIPYYGTIFIGEDANGENANASIKGYTDELVIEATASTKAGTEFIIPLSDVNTVGDSKLINFITKTKKGVDKNVVGEIIFKEVKGLTLNFDLEVTKEAIAEIVVDKNTGSILRGSGNGFMSIVINTKGKFEIDGVFVVDNGIYEFRNIVNKDFIVQPGGTVIWDGNPFDAYLNNIKAVYHTKANPGVLLENDFSRDIDVDLVANITGQLLNSDIDFDVEIPNSSSTANSELEFKLNDEDKKMTQFFSLLTTGSFINLDEGLNFDTNAALTGTISEKISDILSNILKSKGDIFDVGVTYDPGQRGNNFNSGLVTDDQFGLTFKGRIGKKIIYNGKVGVPLGGNTQASVIGEVELELPLNESETFRAKVYNKQNQVQFTVADEEGYTQGIGLSYRVDFDTGKELKEKVFGKKEAKKKKKSTDSLKVKKKLINFTKIKKDSIKKKP